MTKRVPPEQGLRNRAIIRVTVASAIASAVAVLFLLLRAESTPGTSSPSIATASDQALSIQSAQSQSMMSSEPLPKLGVPEPAAYSLAAVSTDPGPAQSVVAEQAAPNLTVEAVSIQQPASAQIKSVETTTPSAPERSTMLSAKPSVPPTLTPEAKPIDGKKPTEVANLAPSQTKPSVAPAPNPANPMAVSTNAVAAAAEPAKPKSYTIQLGVFSSRENAESLQAKLALQGYKIRSETRIYLDPTSSRREAEELLVRLRAMGVHAVIVPNP